MALVEDAKSYEEAITSVIRLNKLFICILIIMQCIQWDTVEYATRHLNFLYTTSPSQVSFSKVSQEKAMHN